MFHVADGVATRDAHSGPQAPTNQASDTLRVLVNPENVTPDGEIDIFDEFQVRLSAFSSGVGEGIYKSMVQSRR